MAILTKNPFPIFASLTITACLISTACAQTDTRSNLQAGAGAQSSDLELAGPTNGGDASPAPPAKIDLSAPEEPATKKADTGLIAGDPPGIPDPDRSQSADDMPILPSKPIDLSETTVARPTQDISLEDRVARLEQLIEAQSEMLVEMARAQSQMMAAQKTPTDELTKIREEIAALRKSMDSFQALGRVDPGSDPADTQPSLQSAGRLVVDNFTGISYTVSVNGTDFIFSPGRNEVIVPVGNVVTEIRGYETPKTWVAENFRPVGSEQHLEIQIKP